MQLDGQPLTLEVIADVACARRGETLELSSAARKRMNLSRDAVERFLRDGHTVYGINTGFGKLADVRIAHSDLQQLQLNLVRSHACGVGSPLAPEETRAMMLLRANVLAKGLSGARPCVADTLLAMLNADVLPVIPETGSVGASGDLAPLAHLALACIGEGECLFEGARVPSRAALERAGIAPLVLAAKEGLALLNGTQALAATGALALRRAERLLDAADIAGAMTLEALRGTPAAFDARIHDARPFAGQTTTAARMRALLRDSEIRLSHIHDDPRVQDAYSLRCIPQVHGAVRDALTHARTQTEIETGSATDNPLVFVNETNQAADVDVISGGNFHGAPLALAYDYAAIALAHLGNISERRTERLVNPDLSEGLPAFLARAPGMSSGFMIAQVAAVALLNEIKVLAHPASTDNLPTSANKEDHVSMGMTAALKLRRIVSNMEYVVAIELMCAAEGLEHRLPLRPGAGVRQAFEIVREIVSPLTEDRALSYDITRLAARLRDGAFDNIG